MHNIDELLKNVGGELGNVVPLVLLMAFWWIFSMLTSKAKKMSKKDEEGDSPGLQERFLKAVTGDQSTNEGLNSKPASPEVYDAYRSEDVYYPGSQTSGGQTTAKPIHPRWWAA